MCVVYVTVCAHPCEIYVQCICHPVSEPLLNDIYEFFWQGVWKFYLISMSDGCQTE